MKQNAYKASNGNCWWWLRSPGSTPETACDVYYSGARGNSHVSDNYDDVRPAFWLDLSGI